VNKLPIADLDIFEIVSTEGSNLKGCRNNLIPYISTAISVAIDTDSLTQYHISHNRVDALTVGAAAAAASASVSLDGVVAKASTFANATASTL
jgi:hypothetical protein